MNRLLIFGTGSVAESLFPMLDLDRMELVGFVDDKRQGDIFHGHRIYSSLDIHDLSYDAIIVASGYVRQISALLRRIGVPKEKIISYIYDDALTYSDISANIEIYLDKEYNRSQIYQFLKAGCVMSDIFPAVIWSKEFSNGKIYKDFVREKLVRMIASQLNDRQVRGDVAELGVYKGDFTIVMEDAFPTRKLYLFDTFSGFVQSDVERDDSIENKEGEWNKFKDTSVEYVSGRLKHKENVCFKEGHFPNSFDLWDSKFAFVSVDFNIEKPVLDALDIFYPLMEKGGVIMVSDYYAPYYIGARKSVDAWCRRNDKYLIPIPDFYGSVLIVRE